MARAKRTLTDVSNDPLAKLQKDVEKTAPRKPATAETETKMLNTRIPKDLIKRIKIFCAENEMTMQDFIIEASQEKLK
jgi:predicted DNA binding CopG/RHH family protein